MDATFSRRNILTPQTLRALAQRSDLRGAAQAASIAAKGRYASLRSTPPPSSQRRVPTQDD